MPCACEVVRDSKSYANEIHYCPLHAAAPELLKVCHMVLKTLQEMDISYETGDEDLKDVAALKALLARVEGR